MLSFSAGRAFFTGGRAADECVANSFNDVQRRRKKNADAIMKIFFNKYPARALLQPRCARSSLSRGNNYVAARRVQ